MYTVCTFALQQMPDGMGHIEVGLLNKADVQGQDSRQHCRLPIHELVNMEKAMGQA